MTTLPTEAMIEAGFITLWRTEFAQLGDKPTLYKETVRSIYLAMQAARPIIDTALVEKVARAIYAEFVQQTDARVPRDIWPKLSHAALEAIDLPNIEEMHSDIGALVYENVNLSARLERAEGALKVAQLALPVLRTMLNKAGFHVGAERALETFNAVNKALEANHAKG